MARSRPLALALGLAAAACAPSAETAQAECTPSMTIASEPCPIQLQIADLRSTVETAHEKFVALAEAMPTGTLDWRPMEGVRSVSEVYIHVAADNYYVPALLGVEAPAETGITSDNATFQAYQQQTMTHDEMITAVNESFVFYLDAMDELEHELYREVTLGQPTTVGDIWIRATVHLHEHLGQAIAYARSNEVVPPWSR